MLEPNRPVLVGDLARRGEDDRALRRDDSMRRVRRGAYVPAEVLAAASADERYDLRIHAVLGTRRSPLVLSHFSAARVWGLPIVTPWPWHVHATVDPASPRRSKNGVLLHRHKLGDDEVVAREDVLVTSLVRTAIDMALLADLRDAVALLDFVLHDGLLSADELAAALETRQGSAGRTRAVKAVRFADALAASPGESFSRVLMHELDFPAPVLQLELATPSGRRFADFAWPAAKLIGEFDGFGKYVDDPAAKIWEEKRRENELRTLGFRVARWSWSDLTAPLNLTTILETAGLKRRRPRGYSARSGR